MYEFVCNRIVPGCATVEKGDTREAVREKAHRHLREHHGMEYLDGNVMEKVDLALALIRR